MERRDEATGRGPYLKCGRVGKPITRVMDLGENANVGDSERGMNMTGGQGAIVIKCNKNPTKFHVITSKAIMKLKAASKAERD